MSLQFDGPLDRLAHAYYCQGLDTLWRLLRLVPDGKRQTVRMAWGYMLNLCHGLSEDELADVAANVQKLQPGVEDLLRDLAELAKRRHAGPSQQYPSEGP